MQQRSYRQPYTNAVETVGSNSIWGALFAGPFYYVKKGALIEGAIMGAMGLMFFFMDDDTASLSPAILDNISWIIWGVFVIFAPVLLAYSYKRRGWVEITTSDSRDP
jgi:hypothetical protein